jgi:hypothetical protein
MICPGLHLYRSGTIYNIWIADLDVRIIHRLPSLLMVSLFCLITEPAWVTSLGLYDYNWSYYPSQAYVAQYNILDIETPSGSISGIVGHSYSYSTSATDPDGDQVQYTFDWGDGSTTLTGIVDSGISVTATHSWSKKGTYKVRAKAIDADVPGVTSEYSDPLIVTIKR